MSCNYAQGLSEYSDKGVCGIPEVQDESELLDTKVTKLVELIRAAKNIVFHTGAGLSTSAGIPDFRGPKGVWTLEKKGERPPEDVSFDRATPTFAHRFLRALAATRGKGVSVVSQNIDGLHLRSGLRAPQLYELHGNMFLDQCDNCARLFIRNSPSPTVGQKYTGHSCPWGKTTGRRPCRGNLCDTILDWEAELPPDDLTRGSQLSKQADLSICLGTTLQIIPSGTLPLLTLDKSGGKLVICNLQPTKYDDKAELVIHGYVDQVLKKTAELLGLEVPEYDPKTDPTRTETLHTFYRTPALKTRLSHLEQPEEEYIPRKRRRKLNTTPASQKKPSVKKTKKDLTNGHQPIKQEQTQVKPEQMEINEDKKEEQPNQVKSEEIETNAAKKEDPTNQVKLEQIENNADNKEEPDIRVKPEKIEHNASKKDEQPNQVKPEQIKNNADKEEQPKQIKPEQIKNNADKKEEQPNQVKPEQIENKKEEPDIQSQSKEPQQPEVTLKGTKEPS